MPWTSVEPDLVPDRVLTAAFAGCLPGARLAGPLLAFAAVDSTQTMCRRLAAEGAPEGTVVVADYQRAGRGQGDRRWIAPPGAGLLFSCLLRPPSPASRWPGLTLVAARAVADGVAACAAIAPWVKWPNDVLVGERKLAGVLAEGVVGPDPSVVLGVGINVAGPPGGWPPGLEGHAVSLAELGRPVAREPLLGAVLARLAVGYAAFLAEVPAAVAG